MNNLKRLAVIFGESEVVNKTQDELIDMLIDKYFLLGGQNLKPIKEIPVDFDRIIFKKEWIDNIPIIDNRGLMNAFTIGIDGEPKAEYIGSMDFGDAMEKDRGMLIVVGGSDSREAYSMKKAYLRNKASLGFHYVACHLEGMSLSSITTSKEYPKMHDVLIPELFPIVTDTDKSVNPNDRKYQSKSKKQRRKK